MKSYGTCLSLTGLFHLAQYSPGPSMQSQRKRFPFLWLCIILLHTTAFKKDFIHLFLERVEGTEKEKETLFSCLLQAANLGPGL